MIDKQIFFNVVGNPPLTKNIVAHEKPSQTKRLHSGRCLALCLAGMVFFSLPAAAALPGGSVVINGGDAYTTSGTVLLTLDYFGGNGYVVIEVAPPAGSGVWGVEETIPPGLTVSNITGPNGTWDNFGRRITWWFNGATQLTYELAGDDGQYIISGEATFGGLPVIPIIGDTILNMPPEAGGGGEGEGEVEEGQVLRHIYSGIAAMRFSNDGISWSVWESALTTKAWALSGNDGLKTVYVEFRDFAGNVSASTIADDIFKDVRGPRGGIIINGGAEYTNDIAGNVVLTLDYDDWEVEYPGEASGVFQMCFSNDGVTWSDWEPVAETKAAWTLATGDGPKTVYVQYSDLAGNISAGAIKDHIFLDTVPPAGAIIINDGDMFTIDINVDLDLSYNDPSAPIVTIVVTPLPGTLAWGVEEYIPDELTVSSIVGSNSQWDSFNRKLSWWGTGDLESRMGYMPSGADGDYLLAGLVNFDGLEDAAVLGDTSLRLPIPVYGEGEDGIAGAAVRAIRVTGSGVDQMRLSNDGVIWTSWFSAAPEYSWVLLEFLAGSCARTVYVQFMDKAGNVSDTSHDDILLYSAPEIITCAADPGPLSLGADCAVALPDLTGGVDAQDSCGDPVVSVVQSPEAGTLITGDTLVTFTVKDFADNTATCDVTVTVVDDAAPVIDVCAAEPGPIVLNANCEAVLPDFRDEVVASDNCTDVLDLVVTQNPPPLTVISANTLVTLTVEDVAGNTDECYVAVTVVDDQAPSITLLGVNPQNLGLNDPYVELGATAWDNCDGDLTAAIAIDASGVDMSAVGSYSVYYNVSDSASNAAVTVTRTVNVFDTDQPFVTDVQVRQSRVVWVTFNKEMGAGVLTPANYTITGAGAGTLSPNPLEVIFVSGNTYGLIWQCPDIMFNGGDVTITVALSVADSFGNTMYEGGHTGTDAAGGMAAAPNIIPGGADPAMVACGGSFEETATAFDSCGTELTGSIVVGGDVLDTGVPGTYILTYNVVDAASNAAAEVSRTVMVVDTAAPVITLIGLGVVQVECGDLYVDDGATATDLCEGDLAAAIIVGGDVVDSNVVGSYVVTYNVSDSAANAAVEATRSVTVVDTTAPVITLIGDPVVEVECGDVYTDDGATAFDECAGDLTAVVVIGGDTVDTGAVGEYLITYDVSDPASNAAVQVVRLVRVVDTTAPTITLTGDAVVEVQCGDDYTDAGATAADACDGDLTDAVIVDDSDVNTGSVGSYTVTYNVADAGGNAAVEVTRTVNVIDTAPPVITLIGADEMMLLLCPDDEIPTLPGATALDVCDGDLTAAIVVGGDVVSTVPGVYVITYDVSDSYGNAAVEVVRTVTVDIPTGLNIYLENLWVITECGDDFTPPTGYVRDGCDEPFDVVVDIEGSVAINVPGDYILIYTYPEVHPSRLVVTVIDTVPPVITLVGDAVVEVQCGSDYTDPGATAFDACEGDLTDAIVVGGDAVDPVVVGIYVVTYNVSDAASNVAVEAERTVNVVDTAAPVITLLGDADVNHECGEDYTDDGATAEDACEGDLTDAIVVGGDTVNPYVVGTYLITYNVSDGASNAAVEVERTVNVIDTNAPAVILQGENPVVVECGGTYVDAGATAADACDGDLSSSIVVGGDAVNTNTVGTYVVTYNVPDASANAAPEVTRTVHVVDTTVPVIVLLGEASVTVECRDVYVDAGARASDICDGDLTASISVVIPVNTTQPGVYTVTYTVSDTSSNAAAEITRTVDVVDTVAPAITVLGDTPATVECGSAYADAGATAFDLCDGDLTGALVVGGDSFNPNAVGTYLITYNVVDTAANAAPEATREVNVVDTTAPVITVCPDAPAPLSLGANCEVALPDLTDAVVATDNCGDAGDLLVAQSPTAGTMIAGDTQVILTVTDTSGNTAECVVAVSVVDDTDPIVVVCPDAPVTLALGDTCDVAVPDLTGAVVAEDNCGGIVVTQYPLAGTMITSNTNVALTVSDAEGNTVQCVVAVVVVDDVPPVIILQGDATVDVECGDAYVDIGATVLDNCSGTLTTMINVDTTASGTYVVNYSATDTSGNAAVEVERTVNVVDTEPPEIVLAGDATVILGACAPYEEAGLATVVDRCEGDLMDTLAPQHVAVHIHTASAEVLTTTLNNVQAEFNSRYIRRSGVYVLAYAVTDRAGNEGVVERTVVVACTVPDITGLPLDEAIEIIVASGLDYEVRCEFSTTVPPGNVIRQEPLPGNAVPDEGILIYVASTPVVHAADAEVACASYIDAQAQIADIFENVTADDGCGTDMTDAIRVRYITWVNRRNRMEYLDLEAIAAGIEDFEAGEYDYTVGKTQKLFHYLLVFRPGVYTVNYELLNGDDGAYYTYETVREQQIRIADECRGCLGCLSCTNMQGCRASYIPGTANDLKGALGDWLLIGLSVLGLCFWQKTKRF